MIEKGRDGDPQWLADGWVLKPLMSCRTLRDAEFYGLLTWETDENHADWGIWTPYKALFLCDM